MWQKNFKQTKNEKIKVQEKMKKIIKVQIKWMNVFVSDDCVCLSVCTQQRNISKKNK